MKSQFKIQGAITPKLSDRFIVIIDPLFDDIAEKLIYADWVDIRDDNEVYIDQATLNIPENESPWAKIYRMADYEQWLIYVPHLEHLYSCKDIIEAMTIINELKASEALKIIPKVEFNVNN